MRPRSLSQHGSQRTAPRNRPRNFSENLRPTANRAGGAGAYLAGFNEGPLPLAFMRCATGAGSAGCTRGASSCYVYTHTSGHPSHQCQPARALGPYPTSKTQNNHNNNIYASSVFSSISWLAGKGRPEKGNISTHLRGAWRDQKSTLSRYFSSMSGTPEPPYSAPSALRIMVMGCIGNS